MQPTAGIETTSVPDAPPPGTLGLLDEIKGLWDEIRHMIHDHIELAALETRRAGETMAFMVIAGVAIAILLVSAWFAFLAAVVVLLVAMGMWASAALLLIVLLNIAVSGLLAWLIKQKSRNLKWSATLESLKPIRPSTPGTPNPSAQGPST